MSKVVDYNIPAFKLNSNIYDVVCIMSSSINSVIYVFSISQQLKDSLSKQSQKMVKISNLIVALYFILYILSIICSGSNNHYYSRFTLYIDHESDAISSTSYLDITHNIWLCINILNQYIIVLYQFFTIKRFAIRKETMQRFIGRGAKSYFSTMILWLLAVLSSIFFFSMKVAPYAIIVIVHSTLGLIINYFIPLLVYTKITKNSILSYSIISRVIIVYILSMVCLASLFNSILLDGLKD